MLHVQEKLSMKLNTNHGLWSWALRHASWLLNRFAVVNGSTPFELVYQKVYKGRMTEFAEPAFAYTHTALKGNPKWQPVIVLGKTESQDTYVVFTGTAVMLTRSVRRVSTDWKCHLGFYLHFNAPTWKFKTGFGGRVVPTNELLKVFPQVSKRHKAMSCLLLFMMLKLKQSRTKLQKESWKNVKWFPWAMRTKPLTLVTKQ